MNTLIAEADFTLIATVIHKQRLSDTYRRTNNPYELALTFCMERTYGFLQARNQHTLKTHVVVERRGKREDDALELAFRRICDGDNQQGPMPGFEIIFADKKSTPPDCNWPT